MNQESELLWMEKRGGVYLMCQLVNGVRYYIMGNIKRNEIVSLLLIKAEFEERINGMYKEEVALRFGYPYERIDEARKLERLLDSKGIKFLFYESNGYWKHEFCG